MDGDPYRACFQKLTKSTREVELGKEFDKSISDRRAGTSKVVQDTTKECELGKEFDENTPDGCAVTSKVVQEGNKLICSQTDKGSAQVCSLTQLSTICSQQSNKVASILWPSCLQLFEFAK